MSRADEVLGEFRQRCFEVRDLVYAEGTDPQDIDASVQKLKFSTDQAKATLKADMVGLVEDAFDKSRDEYKLVDELLMAIGEYFDE